MSRLSDDLSEQALTFGRFRLFRRQKRLLEGDKPVRLGSRAFELLAALVERAGEVITRDELEARIWPSTVVEETSLRAHVCALRKALGDGRDGARFIVNDPGRGYCFVAAVAQPSAARATPRAPRSPGAFHNLPFRLTRVIGRSDAIDALSALVAKQRLVTISGPGGMGKTTVALAVAEKLLGSFVDGVWLVELAPITDPARVPGAVASSLQMSVSVDHPMADLSAFVSGKNMLIVLDTCEHVLDAAAALAEGLLKACDSVSILTTSRQRLNAQGEWVYRLASLDMPPDAAQLTSTQALTYPAVQLFVERAMQVSEGFTLSDADAPVVCSVCRQLDGMPLAIELAAGRVDSLGVRELADGLTDRLRLLARGCRTASPRHQALKAMLDWSYQLLSAAERSTLCRLAVFKAGFTLEAASAVASDDDAAPADAIACVMDLTVKSLVSADSRDSFVRYRLLNTTRAYALEKLLEAGDGAIIARRHANCMWNLLAQAEADRDATTREQWLANCGRWMDDVWACLDWCFSSAGDPALGVAVTAAALLPVYELGLLDQHHARIQQALNAVQTLSPAQPVIEMRLNAALIFPSGQPRQQARAQSEVIARMLELADRLKEPRYRIAALYGLWGKDFRDGEYPPALDNAVEVSRLAQASADSRAMLLSDRLLAQSHHFMGNHAAASVLAERVLDRPLRMPLEYTSPVPYSVAMRIVLARVLWIQGRADRAVEVAAESVRMAADHPFALTQALALAACPIALWRGDTGAARALVNKLMEHSDRHPSAYWQSWGRSYDAVLAIRESRESGTVRHARPFFQTGNVMELDCLATLADGLAPQDVLLRAARGTVGWSAPEILRRQAEAALEQNTGQSSSLAETVLMESLALARRQGALAWELRTATSLGCLWSGQRRGEARQLVSSTLERFTEGLETADLCRARRLLEELSG
ncbi:ATP-binding protein [Caenimonas soli]|uniref:ATP-binding protein n=1 Tax=Caenimonas soli TaxID=2735555 RepID=UPI001555E421|nr:winged helix-turn-helix domain-containing protein [Caenimonas soli]NPC57884.1 helix-turn-helix transcriptional regulator [Caenimonas soli]